jgi:hypothetical protein
MAVGGVSGFIPFQKIFAIFLCATTMSTSKVDYKDELAKIEEEIQSLVAKIELSAKYEENEPSDLAIKWFRAHCALQHQLGLAWHRQAQLEEEARIEQVRKDAVESEHGRVSRPFVAICVALWRVASTA